MITPAHNNSIYHLSTFFGLVLQFILCFYSSSAFAQPVNNTCAGAQVIVPSTTCANVSASFSGATLDATAPSCANNASQDLWYQFTASTETNFIQLNASSGLNHGFQVIEGSCSGAILHCINTNGSSTSEGGLFNNFIPGNTYFLRIFNAASGLSTANFSFCVQSFSTPSNNDCANAQVITPSSNCTSIPSSFAGSSLSTTVPSCGTNASQDLWYQFTASTETNFIQLNASSGLNHGFQVIQGSCSGAILHCINTNGSSTSEGGLFNNFIPGNTYFLRIFNAASGLSTANFSFCVQSFSTPSNNDCANAQVITPSSNCTSIPSSFAGSSLSTTVPSCGTNASQDLWYQFTASTETNFIQLNASSGLNHGFQVIEGSCSGAILHCINTNGSSTSEGGLFNNFIPGNTYFLRIFNAASGLSTANFSFCVQSFSTPSNNDCANAQVITPSSNCTSIPSSFAGSSLSTTVPSCGTNASQDLWYQFTASTETNFIQLNASSGLNHGFQVIEGSCSGAILHCINTNGSSTSEGGLFNNFIPGNTYFLRIFNAASGLTTANFSFCVQSFSTPSNNDCANAQVITPSSNCTSIPSSFAGSSLSTTVPSCGTNASQDLWYQFTASTETNFIQLNASSGLNHGFQVIEGSCSGAILHCINANGSSTSEGGLFNNFIPGNTYFLRIFNAASGLTTANFSFCVQSFSTPLNNTCINAIELSPNTTCTPFSSSLAGSSISGAMPTCATSATQDVWFRFIATQANMTVTLSAVSGLNHGFQVFDNPCTTGASLLCINNNGSSSSESGSFASFIPGNTYFVRVFNVSSTLTTANFTICVIGAAPVNCVPSITISSNQGTTICAGSSVTFTSSISNGGSTPAYQWRINGINTGSNNSFLVTSSLANGDIVTCQLTSNATCANPNQVTSNAVSMIVNANTIPLFNQIPGICQGESLPALPGTSLNGIGGTWSPAPNNQITTLYTFTPFGGTCATQATMSIPVNAAILPTFTQVPAICQGAVLAALPTTSNNGITGTWSPALNNQATTTYTFTPNQGQCAANASLTITVNPGTVPTFTTVPSICQGAVLAALPGTSNNGITGTWSPALNNQATTTYTFTPNQGQCAANASLTITVNPGTVPTFTTVPSICQGAVLAALPGTSNNGITGTWSPALNNQATTTYTFTPNQGQCATNADLTVVINDLPMVTLVQDGNLLIGSSGYSSYVWSFNGEIIPNEAENQLIAIEFGTYSLTVTDANGCANSTTIFYQTTGYDAFHGLNTLNVYPNPAHVDLFASITSRNHEACTLHIYSIQGQIIKSYPIVLVPGKQIIHIDLSEYHSGIYIAEISLKSGHQRKRFVVSE